MCPVNKEFNILLVRVLNAILFGKDVKNIFLF